MSVPRRMLLRNHAVTEKQECHRTVSTTLWMMLELLLLLQEIDSHYECKKKTVPCRHTYFVAFLRTQPCRHTYFVAFLRTRRYRHTHFVAFLRTRRYRHTYFVVFLRTQPYRHTILWPGETRAPEWLPAITVLVWKRRFCGPDRRESRNGSLLLQF
jgi:hypothetical protein